MKLNLGTNISTSGWFGALFHDEMINGGMKGPKWVNPRARFYFTEKGWREVGKALYLDAKRRGFNPRLEVRKNPKRSDVVHCTSYEVAVLPNKRR